MKKSTSGVRNATNSTSKVDLGPTVASIVIVALIGTFILSLLNSSAEPAVLRTEATAPAVLFEALDTSKSARKDLPQAAEQLGALTNELDPWTWATVFRFDSRVDELYSALAPSSDEELLTDLTPKLASIAKQDDTYVDALFAVFAKRVPLCRGRCVIVVHTDWFCEGMTSDRHKLLREAASRLARCKNLAAVFFLGVDPSNVARLREDLEPLSDRLQFPPSASLNQLVCGQLESGEVPK